MSTIDTYTVFDGQTRVAHGSTLADVVHSARAALATGPRRTVSLFDDATGRMTDLDATSTADEALAQLRPAEARRTGPGRPKLGVVSRELSLLPRHWDWLGDQPGGASAAVRRLVDQARKGQPGAAELRAGREAAWRFLSTIAPEVPDAEEVSRALFAGRYDDVRTRTSGGWPADVRSHFLALVDRAERRDQPVDPGA
ncbi:MAG: DUF2239 family protein [Myxococcota bacterium]